MKIPTKAVGDSADVAISDDDRRVFLSRPQSDRVTHRGGGIWEVPGPSAWREKVCAKLDSNPTDEQWDLWISDDDEPQELCPKK